MGSNTPVQILQSSTKYQSIWTPSALSSNSRNLFTYFDLLKVWNVIWNSGVARIWRVVGPTRRWVFPTSRAKRESSEIIGTSFCIENTYRHLWVDDFADGSTCGLCMAILCAHVARSHVKALRRASCWHSTVPVSEAWMTPQREWLPGQWRLR